MIEYIKKIKRKFRDIYNFIPSGGTQDDPNFDNIPNGEYPMDIDSETVIVKITDGKIGFVK